MATSSEIKEPVTAAYSDGAVVVAPGDTLYIHTDSATGIPGNESVAFYFDTPDNDLLAFVLTGKQPWKAIESHASLIGKKAVTTAKIGIGKVTT